MLRPPTPLPTFKNYLAVRNLRLRKLFRSKKACRINLTKDSEPVACGLGWTVYFTTLADGGRTNGDGFHPLRQAEQVIPIHVRSAIGRTHMKTGGGSWQRAVGQPSRGSQWWGAHGAHAKARHAKTFHCLW